MASTVAYWRRLAGHRDVPRPPVASLHRAQRPDPQGPELRADRGDHGRLDDVPPRDPGRGPQLGLPLHLDPGHRVHAARRSTAWASTGRRSSTSPSCWRPSARGKLDQPFELQIMYGIGGERDLTERTLDHLSGYEGARPGPGRQRRLEPAPERRLGDAARRRRHPPQARAPPRSSIRCGRGWPGWSRRPWPHSGDADQGIWEIRGEPQHFTASAVLCWVAADRGADLARRPGRHRAGRTVAAGRR